MMAAFLPEYGMVIGQVEVANGEVKENEIVAAPKLLLQIEKYIAGSVLVGDAMQCQRKLSVQIRAAKGDWAWLVKHLTLQQPCVHRVNVPFWLKRTLTLRATFRKVSRPVYLNSNYEA